MRYWLRLSLLAMFALVGAVVCADTLPKTNVAPDFNREVRPILSGHCFKCHGPDDKQRAAGLRLDLRSGATLLRSGGKRAVTPGKPDQSVAMKRILSTGADIMPPPHANKPLTKAQKQILRRWIEAGATYDTHWAFVPPKPAPLPSVKRTGWVRNPIDRFILAKLEAAGMQPSAEADRYTLLRRVHLDLIGLPPTPDEIKAFVEDTRPDSYGRLVDRLLASPHYGERWGRRWLDLARYADTNGYEKDRPRSIWLYRDWIINAFNSDMPFDRFTIEQLAGDMLPNATVEQRVATGFHRNTMINEEGGIDPLEFRFHSMTDRVATTGTTWLGLTLGCAQCHTHKFDPITQREYYQTMAFLNNADEPTLDVPKPDIVAKRKEIEQKIAQMQAELAGKFPIGGDYVWSNGKVKQVNTTSGAKAETLDDGSVLISGVNPNTDTYQVTLETVGEPIDSIRLEALPHPALGATGPGRTEHGNFVLTELKANVVHTDGKLEPIRFSSAEADFEQEGFPANNTLDGQARTGWAIHGEGKWNVARTAKFHLSKSLVLPKGSHLRLELEQAYGGQHTLGRFRIGYGKSNLPQGGNQEERRRALRDLKFAEWQKAQEARAISWKPTRPTSAKSGLPLLTIENDGTIYASGDQSKRDIYDLNFTSDGSPITSIRLDALADSRLPLSGPGRIYYEGPPGDFFLSEVTFLADGKPVKITSAVESFASGGNNARAAIDGDPQTGWSINGQQGKNHSAFFTLEKPVTAKNLSLKLLFERYYAAGMGRLRVSFTSEAKPVVPNLPFEIERTLTTSASQRSKAQRDALFQEFLMTTPELQIARNAIQNLRNQLPAFPTTLAFEERPSNNPRQTFVHKRGEFLQPQEKVRPATLTVLHSFPKTSNRDRLNFAKWLVSPQNPLVGRVTMNREWAAFFGKGIVTTTEDFGYQGTSPSHPELLDWLALEFVRQGWSLKKMHRLIVTSATYRQSSKVTPTHLKRDPENVLLARAPRLRLEAELLRDSMLTASGLLSRKLGGPSVFPPQPPGITTEGTYGPLAWNVSMGEDRYRRGLYTFSKRTAPYAMFQTFDGPSGEFCIARREVSNTPLQALTLLNDQVALEASRYLGKLMEQTKGSNEEKVRGLFQRILTRPPSADEQALVLRYFEVQKARLAAKELDAKTLLPDMGVVNDDMAAWSLTARSILNLDEAVSKQ